MLDIGTRSEMGGVRDISTADTLCGPPCMLTQLPALRRKEVRTLSEILNFTRSSVRYCETSMLLISSEYTKTVRIEVRESCRPVV